MKFATLFAILVSLVEAYEYHREYHNQAPEFNVAGRHNGQIGVEKTPSLNDIWGQDWAFSGIQSFAHLPADKCLLNPDASYDIGLIGVPFDTATSYRPGLRFGPAAIRAGSQRQNKMRGFNHRAAYNPYLADPLILDCGDIPVSPMDNGLLLKQMTLGFEQLYNRTSKSNESKPPAYIALGGDHSIVLPHLRAVSKAYGQPVAIIHFDAHLDTWTPNNYPNFWHSDQSEFTHGSMLWMAHEEGVITDDKNVHIGLRTRLSGTDYEDYESDDNSGFIRIDSDDIWLKGVDYAVKRAVKRIGTETPVFISVDIDVLDPGFAPGTGTIESGGLLPRELIYILRKLEVLNIVGADIVEVSPAYDSAEVTATNAAQVVFELLTSISKNRSKDIEELKEVVEPQLKSPLGQNVLQAAKHIVNHY